MQRSLRTSKKVRNLLIYLSNNGTFRIIYSMLMIIALIFNFFVSNKILYFSLIFMIEMSFIISGIRETDKNLVKNSKLRYVIFSNFAPIIYPLLLASTYIDLLICNIIAYFFNLEKGSEGVKIDISIILAIYVVLTVISVILTIMINKKCKKKLKEKFNSNDIKLICR